LPFSGPRLNAAAEPGSSRAIAIAKLYMIFPKSGLSDDSLLMAGLGSAGMGRLLHFGIENFRLVAENAFGASQSAMKCPGGPGARPMTINGGAGDAPDRRVKKALRFLNQASCKFRALLPPFSLVLGEEAFFKRLEETGVGNVFQFVRIRQGLFTIIRGKLTGIFAAAGGHGHPEPQCLGHFFYFSHLLFGNLRQVFPLFCTQKRHGRFV